MGKRKLLLTGATIVELRKEAQEFLKETQSLVAEFGPDVSDDIVPDAQLPLEPQGLDPEGYPENPLENEVPASGDVDSAGMPWDERIHASSRAVTSKGLWRSRRGVEPAEIARVENELRGKKQHTAPVAQQYPPAPAFPGPVPTEAVNTPPPFAPPSLVPPLGNAPVASPAPAVTATPSALPAPSAMTAVVSLAHNVQTFKANMFPVLAELTKQGKINQEYIASLKSYFQVAEIWNINDAQTNELFESLCNSGLLTRMP